MTPEDGDIIRDRDGHDWIVRAVIGGLTMLVPRNRPNVTYSLVVREAELQRSYHFIGRMHDERNP